MHLKRDSLGRAEIVGEGELKRPKAAIGSALSEPIGITIRKAAIDDGFGPSYPYVGILNHVDSKGNIIRREQRLMFAGPSVENVMAHALIAVKNEAQPLTKVDLQLSYDELNKILSIK